MIWLVWYIIQNCKFLNCQVYNRYRLGKWGLLNKGALDEQIISSEIMQRKGLTTLWFRSDTFEFILYSRTLGRIRVYTADVINYFGFFISQLWFMTHTTDKFWTHERLKLAENKYWGKANERTQTSSLAISLYAKLNSGKELSLSYWWDIWFYFLL